MESLRTKNVVRNICYSYLNLLISGVFSFFSRWLIVFYFSEEYLGLTSLFSSVLQVLCLAELGFSGAIVYNLYKPLAKNDVQKVCAILSFFRRTYYCVGSVILCFGLAILPFVKMLIKDDLPDDINIYLLYLLFLVNTCVGYFVFGYKVSLLDALQRLDLIKKSNSVISIIGFLLQLISLTLLKNFYIYVSVNILVTLFSNVLSAYIATKRFPQYICRGKIDNETKENIIHRVKGLLISNISAVTYTTFDSIILSVFIGLKTVAIYNNYLLIFNTVLNVIILFRGSLQSSIGNSIAVEDKEKNYKDMLMLQLVFSVIATWCVCCLLNLYQPFMLLWMGKGNMLNFIDVILLCIWFYITVISHAFYIYLAGNGLWWEIRIPYMLSAFTNIILNIILGYFFGVTGVVFSTVLANLVFGTIWQCGILFKYYYKKNMSEYYLNQFFYFSVAVIVWALSYLLCNLVPYSLNIFGIVIRFIICSILSLIIMYLFFRKLKSFHYAKVLMKVLYKNKI